MKVKFDKSDPRLSLRAYKVGQKDAFDAIARGAPGTSPAAQGGLGSMQLNAMWAALERTFPDPAARMAGLEKMRAKGRIGDADYEQLRQRLDQWR
jgi:hypothetical protein